MLIIGRREDFLQAGFKSKVISADERGRYPQGARCVTQTKICTEDLFNTKDSLVWFCEKCREEVYKESFYCTDLGMQLKPGMCIFTRVSYF